MKSIPPTLRTRQLGEYVCSNCTRQLRHQRRRYATSSSHPEIYDIVCVGGGPAGLSLLAALRSHPVTSALRIALIESQSLTPSRQFAPSPTAYSNRCSSLTPSSIRFLEQIGAWPHINHARVQAYADMQVWDGVTGARIAFEYPAQGREVGVMNENANLTSALLKRIEELGDVDVLDGKKVTGITLGEENEETDLRTWPMVSVEGGRTLAARLLVGADGQNSPVRAFAGIGSKGWDYDRHGVVASLELEDGGEVSRTAHQRFLPTGPVAMLPLPGKHATLVWSTTPALAAKLKGMSEGDFVGMVNAAFRLSTTDLAYLHTLSSGQAEEITWREKHTPFSARVPGRVVAVQEGTRASFPLKMRHADTYIGERVALIGDAAHTVHPLAGQGLNQGQGDVESLAGTIEYAVAHGMDIGSQMSLEAYNAERYAKNHLLMGVVDKLHKVYAVESGPVVGLRSLGLRAVGSMGWVKGFLMERAAGNGGKMM